jgi:hypothetical protein
VRIDRTLGRVRSHSIGRVWSCRRRSGTFLDMIRRYFLVRLVVLPSRLVTLRALPLTMNSEVRASSHCLAQRLVATADACCCRATGRTRPVLRGPHLVTSTELVSSRSCVRLGSHLYTASRVLLIVLIMGSSYRLRPSHVLHPIELQNNYLQIH